MNWLNNLKVAYKLLILCIIAAIGMITLGRSGYVSLQDANSDMNTIFSQNLKSIYYIGNCRHAMRYMQGMMLIAIIRDHLPFDQLLYEHKRRNGRRWIHVSYVRRRRPNRHKSASFWF